MESLNEIVQRVVESNKRMFEDKGISVEFDFDPNMPKLYPDFTLGTTLNNALAQFNLEIEDAKASRALYKTRYVEDIQRLVLLHNGNQIPKADLAYLNEFLKDIANGKRKWTYWKSGNRIAGQIVKKYGGRIKLPDFRKVKFLGILS